jgi:chromosome segregation protein
MRLKSIKLAGFKSFVDPTTVNFPGNMCAVVGPNGCGKSNIIDAVRWVMGESSAKNLRGESMADVIFNGSVERQAVGRASIELMFDNSDGGVGGEYASYAEISIKRLVSREGQSEYFLNGTKCRRRDITDIFLGTGLGPRSYAIIEQGTISRLVESKPEELRIFIEEAAGISKYKERRRETESRMRRTKENLERLTDLRDELTRQLEHLKRQARAAEKYSEFKSQERELKAQLAALQWRELDAEIGNVTQTIGKLEVKLEAANAEHQQVDTALEQHRIDHADCTDAFNKIQGHYYAQGAEVARIEQTIKHQQERGRQLNDDLDQTRLSLADAQDLLSGDRQKLESWEEEIAALTPELEMSQKAEQASANSLTGAEEAWHSWQQQWDDFNQHAAEARQQAEVQQSRIAHLDQVLARIKVRVEQLQQEQQALAEGPADVEVEVLSDQLAEAALGMEQCEARGDALVARLSSTREQSLTLSAELDEKRSTTQQLRGRQASLEALQQAATNRSDKALGAWLEANELTHKPRLLDQMDVESDWQLAVETVLGDYLQAVCVENIGPLGYLLEGLEQGCVALLDATVADVQVSADLLSSKVQSAGRANALLAGIYACSDLAEAMQRRSSLAPHESAITRDGIWLGPNWLRVARVSDEQGSIIARKQELDELVVQLDGSEQEVTRLNDALVQSQGMLKSLELERQDYQRELQAITREHAEHSAGMSAHLAKIEQVKARSDQVGAEIAESREQFRVEQQGLSEARQLLSAAIEQMDTDSQRREQLLSERDEARATLDTVRQKARHDKDGAHQIAMSHQSLQTQRDSMRQSIDRTSGQTEQLSERCDVLSKSIGENDSPVATQKAELEKLLEQRLQAEGELSEARQRVSQVEHLLREAEQQRVGIEQRSGTVRSELEQVRLNSQRIQVQRETILSQLKESDHKVDDVLQSMPSGANEAEWQENLEQVAGRVARLGPINLAAIDEYDLQAERKNYLDAQNEDLETALGTLESAIRKIDKETRNRFQETFDKVNSGLQELFPRFFGGGHAYLEMTGDDLLDTGISIMARPPGKKNSTIHLLSGGEKALTAIALVFSIFHLNPAPFCMLDEVDAPLDDANVGRYARMVKEMSETLQFIYITHNKISMELADQLMGVTMQEPGVSRLVTVDVNEAAELAAL